MKVFLHQRSLETELMDGPNLNIEDLKKTLDDLRWTNKWLGSNGPILSAIKNAIISLPTKRNNKPIKIIDLGCGAGDQIKLLSIFTIKNKYNVQFSGLDSNSQIIAIAKKSVSIDVTWIQSDVFNPDIKWADYDIVLCNLFFHHLTDSGQLKLMNRWHEARVPKIIICDLHRSIISFWGFKIISSLMFFSKMAKHDGLISIKKGFKHDDWIRMLRLTGFKKYSLKWNWPFKYILVIN